MIIPSLWRIVSRHCFQAITRFPNQLCSQNLISRNMHAVCANNSFGILPTFTPVVTQVSDLLRTTIPSFVPSCGFKVKGRLKRRCKDCYFVTRQERLYVICKTHPRHKQMSMKAKPKSTWILSHATQGPQRAW